MPENPSAEKDENDRRWLILRARVYEEKLKEAFRLFRSEGVEPILIKGWAAAREYPAAYARIYNDIDFCVEPQVYERCLAFISSEEGRKLGIDLHAGFRHHDTLAWDDLYENSRLVALDGVEIRILRPEDHFRVLCVHWLTDGGGYRERLLDLWYLLKNHEDDFDWERCLGKLSAARRGWIVKTVAVIDREHRLDRAKIPFAGELDRIPGWLTRTLAKEWATATRLLPLQTVIGDRRALWQQIRKRIPPNAIQATIEMEGRFDDSPRICYQLGSVYARVRPSVRRILGALRIGKNTGDRK